MTHENEAVVAIETDEIEGAGAMPSFQHIIDSLQKETLQHNNQIAEQRRKFYQRLSLHKDGLVVRSLNTCFQG